MLKAIPDSDPERMLPRDLPRGEVPDAVNPPLGCSFHPRCTTQASETSSESHDIKDAFEARWITMDEADFERERAVAGTSTTLITA